MPRGRQTRSRDVSCTREGPGKTPPRAFCSSESPKVPRPWSRLCTPESLVSLSPRPPHSQSGDYVQARRALEGFFLIREGGGKGGRGRYCVHGFMKECSCSPSQDKAEYLMLGRNVPQPEQAATCSGRRVLLGQNVSDSQGPGRATPVFPADGRIRRETRSVRFSEVLSQPSDKLSK